MQEKDLHKLGKTDLLTLIYKQEKQIQQLTKEVEELKQQLDDRTIKIKEAGSIAEASLRINKIFEVAQQAADEYLKSIKEVNKPSHECAQINGNLTKDEAKSEIPDNFQSENTYEDQTNDKISKELVLVNNKLMAIKPNLLRRVVIFFVYIYVKISVFMKWTAKKVQFFTKKVKLSTKTSFIKLKCDIIKIIECTKSIYDKIEKHMVGFVKYCKMQFPVTMSTISYKTFVFKRKLKSGAKNVSRLCKEKLKAGGLLLAKFTRKFCTEIYWLIIKAFGLIQLICVRAICHIRAFGKYCKQQICIFCKNCMIQFTILKFRIRNIKSYKRKLLEKVTEVKEEKVDNALMVINYKLVLYKINILRIAKRYLKKLKELAANVLKNLVEHSKKEMHGFKGLLNEIKTLSKKKCCIFLNGTKAFFIKVALHLQGFYEYCIEQIAVLKLKISNKIHHVKLINKINENIHIEETRDALILVNAGIERFKPKFFIRIVVILKKGTKRVLHQIFQIGKMAKRVWIKISKEISCKKQLHKLSLHHFVHRANLKTQKQNRPKIAKKQNRPQIAKKTHEEMVKNIEISIPELEKELKRRKEKKTRIAFIKTLSYSAMVIIAFAIITSTSFFKILQVSGSSMEPNLHEGELLITSSFFKFEKGDMVAFYYNDSVLIKRVIATEGDVVYIEDDGTVFVNSVKLEEDYVKELSYGNCDITFPYQVPKNSVFILGDNREVSIDSRSKSIGCISNDKIIGKIQFKLNPFVIY